jgi:hypothetical protein
MEATTKQINSILANGRPTWERPWRRLATDAGSSWKWGEPKGPTRVVVFTQQYTVTFDSGAAFADAKEIMREKGYTNRMWVTPSGYLKVQCDME